MNQLEKPQRTLSVETGKFYWVKPYKKDRYEPAKAKDRHRNGVIYMCFTDGSSMLESAVWDIKQLEPYNEST
jgi:hypothetical protein